MHIIESDKGVNDLFFKTGQELIKYGVEKTVKDNLGNEVKYKEIRPVVVINKNPTANVLMIPGRKMNPFAQVAEGIWTLAGRKDVAFMDIFNGALKQWSDDGEEYRAAYGHRLRNFETYEHNYDDNKEYEDQLDNIYRELKKDHRSRRACASIWHPSYDNIGEETKDTPCNDFLMFKVENDKLDMTVINRSNDLIYGIFNVNIIQFTFIQQMLAASLGYDVGTYYHYSDSIHIYDRGYELFDQCIEHDNVRLHNFYDCNKSISEFNKMGNYRNFVKSLDLITKHTYDSIVKFNSTADLGLEQYIYDSIRISDFDGIKFIKEMVPFIWCYPIIKKLDSLFDAKVCETILYTLLDLKVKDWKIAGLIFFLRKVRKYEEYDSILQQIKTEVDAVEYNYIQNFLQVEDQINNPWIIGD